jgi:hypothetical protein
MSPKEWAALIAAIIGIVATLIGFGGTYLFYTRPEGILLQSKVETHIGDSGSRIGKVEEKAEKQQRQMHRIEINVVKIGERLRVRDLEKPSGDDDE